MRRTLAVSATTAVILITTACSDATTPASLRATTLTSAFLTTPAGFSAVNSSYPSAADIGAAWMPGASDDRDGRGGGMGMVALGGPGGPPDGDMMGGGLGREFAGGLGPFGAAMARRPFDGDGDAASACAFDSATGRVSCAPVIERGLTTTRWMMFTDTGGNAQPRADSTTDRITVHIDVAGIAIRRDSATSTLQHTSDRTVSGLASGSTARAVFGTSAGSETTTGTAPSGAFTSVRVAGDTASGLVIPLENGRPTYPTAGTLVRSMRVTLTFEGKNPTTSTRREVVTYDGSRTANVEITENGRTRSCTLPLPRGRLSCS